MFLGSQQDDKDAHDPHTLALSTPQIQAGIFGCKQLFSKHKDSHLLELTRFTCDASHALSTHSFTSSLQLSAYLDNHMNDTGGKGSSLEIYTVHQKNTWAPLSISSDMITLIMNRYHLSPGFLQILACFKDRYMPTEEEFSSAAQSHFTDDRCEFGWVYKYSEKKAVGEGNPWRIRQTGIYQFTELKRARSVLFIIHPSPSAHFKDHLSQVLQQPKARISLLANPMLIHSMLISIHLGSWRDYLEYHVAKLLQLDIKSACTSIEQPLVTFETLKDTRAIEKNILPLEPILASFEILLDDLQEANRIFSGASGAIEGTSEVIKAAFAQFRKDAASYRGYALYMGGRAQSTAQSMLDTINLGFQQLAQSQNNYTMGMAKSAREDSIAIRAVTLVTSLYLPFSFVATMFGMNLFDFDSKSRNLVLSKQLWLYFVISVPLTALTLACWKWRMWRYEKRKPTTKMERPESNSDIELGQY